MRSILPKYTLACRYALFGRHCSSPAVASSQNSAEDSCKNDLSVKMDLYYNFTSPQQIATDRNGSKIPAERSHSLGPNGGTSEGRKCSLLFRQTA
jgi:hypothetical protein